MIENLQLIYAQTKEQMQHSYQHLEDELLTIRAGKASASMLNSVKVDYYGTPTPLAQVANVNTTDARTLVIQPWEKALLDDISTAITYANIGLNPQSNGEVIIINVPALTEERRKELSKRAHAEGEKAKVSVRNARKEAMDEIKKLEKDGMSEDMSKDAQANVQEIVDSYGKRIDDTVALKEKDIMTV